MTIEHAQPIRVAELSRRSLVGRPSTASPVELAALVAAVRALHDLVGFLDGLAVPMERAEAIEAAARAAVARFDFADHDRFDLGLARSERAHAIRPGDVLRPVAAWNRSTRTDRLPAECVVLNVETVRNCETGVMVEVEAIGGGRLRLSAGWFREVAEVEVPS